LQYNTCTCARQASCSPAGSNLPKDLAFSMTGISVSLKGVEILKEILENAMKF